MTRQHPFYAFGAGPLYVISSALLTLAALCLVRRSPLRRLALPVPRRLRLIPALALAFSGVALWILAVVPGRFDSRLRNGELITDGIFRYVRNPIYSAFLFFFTGLLLYPANPVLAAVPVLLWLWMGILLRASEEKWLREEFGDAYRDYCRKTNRVLPWFPKE